MPSLSMLPEEHKETRQKAVPRTGMKSVPGHMDHMDMVLAAIYKECPSAPP